MKRVLVTGATGFIGLEVSKQLAAASYKPRLMVRRPLRAMALGAIDAEMMQGDLSRAESLNRLLDGVDTVIHLGARATFESYEVLKPSIVDGSLNLFEAARRAGVESFVYGGSLLVSVSGRVLVIRIASSASRCERLESGLDTMICRLTYGYFRLKLENTGISNDEAMLLIAATRNGPTRFEKWILH